MMLCLVMLPACSKSSTIRTDVLSDGVVYDFILLSECPLYEYTETELAGCYISLTQEVRKGNLQMRKQRGF